MDMHTTVEELLETVFSMWSMPSLYIEDGWEELVMTWEATVETLSCEMVASQQWRKHKSRRISIVGNRYVATPNEDIEDSACAIVIH
jgi:thymidylate synthase ThyX